MADASFARGVVTGHSAKLAELGLKVQTLEGKLVVAESDASGAKALALLVQEKVFQSGQRECC